jgi:hypothetical protein
MKIIIPSANYSEIDQKAPLRWALTYRDGDTFTGQHGWWKCKDFLNDVVVYLQTGKEFEIYGFKNKAKLNDDGGYMALKNVPAFFEHNLALLNEFLIERGFPPLDYLREGDSHILLIPTEYWTNTFFISVITSLIRACVYQQCETFEHCMVNEPTLKGFSSKMLEQFKLENVEKFNNLLFLSHQYNNSNHPPSYSTHVYHNAGLQSWLTSLEKL